MRAAVLTAPRRFEIVEHQPPEPEAGEILIAVRGCGVCASNLGPWLGVPGVTYPMEPGAPGHEVYGRVAAVGPGVVGLEPGTPVAVLSYRGFAEYDIARASDLVVLPPALEEEPFPGEPVACAVNVARRAAVAEGDDVVIVGVGFLGALLTTMVRRWRPRLVIAVSRRPEALELARRLGADHAWPLDASVVERVGELTGGRMADVVIEATGHQTPLELAAVLTRVRGRLVIAGYHQDGPRSVNLQLWNWRGLDVINAHEREPAVYLDGLMEAVRLVADGALDLAPLLTHRVDLDGIHHAFHLAESRPPGFLKAIVEVLR